MARRQLPKDNDGVTILMQAVTRAASDQVIYALLNMDMDPNRRDTNGETAITRANDYGFGATVEILERAVASSARL